MTTADSTGIQDGVSERGHRRLNLGNMTHRQLAACLFTLSVFCAVPVAIGAPAAGTTGGSAGKTVISPGTATTSGANVALGRKLAAGRGWGNGPEWNCLNWLWTRESGWRVTAYNAQSGALGIPQSLPASKMASAGADYRTNPVTQIRWGLDYITGRYGSPCAAWNHETGWGWY